MKVHDRLYGVIELPPIAEDLARSCPVLLRLREVRLANIPFASYPSFANVTRYEHSLGTAHLAWRFARANGLADDEGLALTLAALYHDGATPAFGHLYEELLTPGGFDHEQALANLLMGTAELHGRESAQIFLGRRCRLAAKVPRSDPDSILSCNGVASILAGQHPLGRVIAGSVDVDNIDNVIRAATAMGLVRERVVHPYDVLDALVLVRGELRRAAGGEGPLTAWLETRQRLYGSILANSYEFRAQAAIKWAIAHAARSEPELAAPASWTLTEPELVFEHLRQDAFARDLVDSVRLGSPPRLVFSANVADVSPLLRTSREEIEMVCTEASNLVHRPVFLNFYLDKADRQIDLPPSQGAMDSGLRDPPSRSRVHGAAAPGVVGLVTKSIETPYSRTRNGPERPTADDLAALLADRLGLEPNAASGSWARPLSASDQLPIFA
jgi:hypothetical protein